MFLGQLYVCHLSEKKNIGYRTFLSGTIFQHVVCHFKKAANKNQIPSTQILPLYYNKIESLYRSLFFDTLFCSVKLNAQTESMVCNVRKATVDNLS